jgi:hypothetical protein
MIGNSQKIINWLWVQDKDTLFEIKAFKQKRSLSQNAYAWKLINEIGNVLSKSKDEIYMQMLEDYGQSMLIPVESGKKPDGFFKYYKFIKSVTINGKEADYYKVFKGSSDFDSKEMSIFIEGIVQECKQLDIETLTPDEIYQLKIH